MTKMTEREIYNAMIVGTIDAEVMREFAEKKLAQLDKRNETAKVRAAKKRAENDVLTEKVFGYVTDDPQSREDIFNAMIEEGNEDLTLGKVSYRLSALAREGRIQKTEATVGGNDGGKPRKVTVYMLNE